MCITISTRAIYKNIPAVAANIHCLVASSVLTTSPIYSPIKANNTFFGVSPADSKTAKSPKS